MRVSIVYHFFAHYRRAVVDCLRSSPLEIGFIADTASDQIERSIKVFVPHGNFSPIQVRRLLGNKYWLLGLASALRKQRPNKVVFLGDINCLSLWVLCPLLRVMGTEVLFWTHGWLDSQEGFLKSRIRCLFLSLANRLLVYGRRARVLIAKQGFDSANIHVVYNSLDYSAQRSLRTASSVAQARSHLAERIDVSLADRPVILCSARLTALKRFDLVIRAVAQLNSRPIIAFVGAGPEQSELSSLSDSLDVDAYFLGECYDEDVLAQLFMASCVVVSPGNVGLTAMHALAYGIPVITHSDLDRQMPEVEAIVENATGYLFEFGSVEALASKLEQHFQKTPLEHEQMRSACIAMIETFFNPENQASQIISALKGEAANEPLTDKISLSELMTGLPTGPGRGAVNAVEPQPLICRSQSEVGVARL